MRGRVKFKVNSINRHLSHWYKWDAAGKLVRNPDGTDALGPREFCVVTLTPVTASPGPDGKPDPGHENTKSWLAAPYGKLKLTFADLAAAERFELGKEYYVDIRPAEEK